MRGIQGKVARAACVAAFVAFAGATPAFAAVELDQSALIVADADTAGTALIGFGTFKGAPPPYPATANTSLIQSVTAGKTGYLDHLDLQVFAGPFNAPQGTVSLTLYDGDFAAGTGSLITTRSISVDMLPAYASLESPSTAFDLRDADFLVTSGQMFSFKLDFFSTADITQTITAAWGRTKFNPVLPYNLVIDYNDYAGGKLNMASTYSGIGPIQPGDLGFRSFVDVSTSAVPEPASWALMLMGFGALGGIMRKRTVRAAFA